MPWKWKSLRTKQPTLAGVFRAHPVPELGQGAERRLREDGKPLEASLMVECEL